MVLSFHPFHDVEITRFVQRDGILVEQVGHDHEVSVGGELVGDELDIVEAVADDVGDAVVGSQVS